MAVASIVVPADAKRDARARALVTTIHTWHTVTLKQPYGTFPAGTQFRQTPNGYRVNAVVCECSDYQRAGFVCKHVRAVVLWEQEQAAPTVAPKRRPSYADLFPECRGGCGDLGDSRDGYCFACGSDRERAQRMAERRVLLANA